jgi:hypothetical protein
VGVPSNKIAMMKVIFMQLGGYDMEEMTHYSEYQNLKFNNEVNTYRLYQCF